MTTWPHFRELMMDQATVRDLEPVPDESELKEELQRARAAAVDAILHAEELEAQARKARRRATSLNRNYERLLLEHGGQLRLPFEEFEEGS